MIKESKKNLDTRPPVVVVLGHVDHGKTKILDFIRKTKVVEKESGGITQHIGAYEAEYEGKKIIFIDTPGHEAFSAIRSRGAKVADIAVLVVAADEGIKPQTKEAILHIKKTGIPIIVALNKIDKPGANPEKVKIGLSKEDILVESLGGKVPAIATSAETGEGITGLLELILLVAEMEGLKGDKSLPGEGVVIESHLDGQRGVTTTLLLRDGTLNQGDIMATSSTLGKVKILEDFKGKQIEKAFPSMPIIVLGLDNVPGVGEKFKVFPNLESAQGFIEKKKERIPEVLSIEPDQRVLNIILKADVLGSLEALEGVIRDLPQEKVVLRILKSEIGEVNENDAKLAKDAKARIFAFRVKANQRSLNFAERHNIKIMIFDVIYELVQKVREGMERSVKSEVVRNNLGEFRSLAIFMSEKSRQIVGGRVVKGEVKKGAQIEVFRKEEMMGRGKIINLQRNKKDTEIISRGDECGILYEGDVMVEEGDILVIYTEERRKGEL